ncbi:MAG: hypothetical protein IIA87_00640 [Nanoarchaeota archaeon]|nr:hypothetical protein [Nanoarchaeota archaeon]
MKPLAILKDCEDIRNEQSEFMKFPTEVNRYCPYCRLMTRQKISVAKQKSRSAAHPLSWGSMKRAKSRGVRSGYGNKGRWGSRPPISKWKRKSKSTKRLTILYTCKVCKKSKGIKKAIRTSRIEIGEKVAK